MYVIIKIEINIKNLFKKMQNPKKLKYSKLYQFVKFYKDKNLKKNKIYNLKIF